MGCNDSGHALRGAHVKSRGNSGPPLAGKPGGSLEQGHLRLERMLSSWISKVGLFHSLFFEVAVSSVMVT